MFETLPKWFWPEWPEWLEWSDWPYTHLKNLKSAQRAAYCLGIVFPLVKCAIGWLCWFLLETMLFHFVTRRGEKEEENLSLGWSRWDCSQPVLLCPNPAAAKGRLNRSNLCRFSLGARLQQICIRWEIVDDSCFDGFYSTVNYWEKKTATNKSFW